MKKSAIALVATLLFSTSCDQSHLQQALVPVKPELKESERVQLEDESGERQAEKSLATGSAAATTVPPDAVVEKRKKMVPAIWAAFARRTTPERAKWLAEVCYKKTKGTVFTPLDLAEIALAETGGHRLSSRAVSPRGALGVWQLMPERAASHGYHPSEMRDDEKCADAAIRELHEKLCMAKGNLSRAKRLYCGQGRAARAYDKIRRKFRDEILQEIDKAMRVQPVQAVAYR